MMFGLDASKKKFNKVWNQRRAASARVAKVSSTSSSNAASTSASNSTSNPPQQRSASFRYRRSEGSSRAARAGHSSDFDDEDDDDDHFTFARSSFTRHGSSKASFKSHNRSTGSISVHQPTAASEPFAQVTSSAKAAFARERAKLAAKPQPSASGSGSLSPSNRLCSKENRPSDVPLSSVVSTSPVTPRYPVPVAFDGAFYKEHYSNYEWIDANGLVVSPPDPALLSCAPCKDIEVQLDPGISLGLTIRGGSEYGLGVFISSIDPRSAAASSGLTIGDQILALNNISWDTTAGISLESAVNTIKRCSTTPASGSPVVLLFTVKRVAKVPSASIVSEEAVASAPSLHANSAGFSIVRKKSLIPSSRCSSSASTVSSSNTANVTSQQSGYHSLVHPRQQSSTNLLQQQRTSATIASIQAGPGAGPPHGHQSNPTGHPLALAAHGAMHQISSTGHPHSHPHPHGHPLPHSHVHPHHQQHIKSASLTAVPSAVAMEDVSLIDCHTASHLSMSHCLPGDASASSLLHQVNQFASTSGIAVGSNADATSRIASSHPALTQHAPHPLYRRPSAMTLMPPAHGSGSSSDLLLSPTSAAAFAEEAAVQRRFSSASLNRRRCSSLHLNPERKRFLPGIPLTASDISLTAVGVTPANAPGTANPRRGSVLPSIPPTLVNLSQHQQSQQQQQPTGQLIQPAALNPSVMVHPQPAPAVPLQGGHEQTSISGANALQNTLQQQQPQQQQLSNPAMTLSQQQSQGGNSLFPPCDPSASKFKRHSTSSFAIPDPSGLLAAAAAAVRRHSSCVIGARGRSFLSPDPSPTSSAAGNSTNVPPTSSPSKTSSKRMSICVDPNVPSVWPNTASLGVDIASSAMFGHSTANLQVPTVNVRRSSVDVDRNSSEDEDDSRLRIPSASGSARRGSGNHLTIPGMEAAPLYLMLPQVPSRRGSTSQGQMANGHSNYANGHMHARVRRHRSLPSPFISHSLLQSGQQQGHQSRCPQDQTVVPGNQGKWSGHRYSIVAAAPGASGMYHTGYNNSMYSGGGGSPVTGLPATPVRSSSFRRPHHRATVEPGGRIRVNVKKSKPFLGIAIEGGSNVPNQKLPRIISILGCGAAFETGNLHVGHIILEVDCISTENLRHEQIAQMIADAYYKTPHKDFIEFVVREKSKHEFDIRTSSFMLLNSSFE